MLFYLETFQCFMQALDVHDIWLQASRATEGFLAFHIIEQLQPLPPLPWQIAKFILNDQKATLVPDKSTTLIFGGGGPKLGEQNPGGTCLQT